MSDEEKITAELLAGLQLLEVAEAKRHAQSFTRFIYTLNKWNKVFNLTAVREPQAMVVMHILDSCAVQPWLVGNNIIDVGTGAGLPGIPLAAINPERQFTLLDSNGKKTRFVTQATAELGLRNVEVVQARIQDYVPPVAFDSILCRAFTSLAEFVKVCDARLAPGGRLLAMKGRLSDDEFAEVPTGWKMDSAVLEVPGLEAERHLIILTRDN